MAAIISTELISYIVPVLAFIFVTSIIYGVLQRFEYFGKSQGVNIFIAFSAGLLFIVVPVLRDLMKEVIPWLMVMVIIIVVVLMILMFMGYKEKNIVDYMTESGFGYVITTLVVMIFLIVLAKVVGPTFLQYPAPTEAGIISVIKRVMFNPKVLGAVFILAVAAYLIKAIAMPTKK